MRHGLLFPVLWVLALALAGCGGGGGGDGPVGDSLDLVEDPGASPTPEPPTPGPSPVDVPGTFAHHIAGLGDERPLAVEPLPGGGFLVGGYFMSEAVFRPGETDESLLDQLGGRIFDAFVARYAADGSLDWVRPLYSAEHVGVERIVAFADGSFVVGGTFEQETIFAFGEPEETLLTTPESRDDLFLARYEADGRLRWARQDGGVDAYEDLRDMDAYPGGAIVVTGYFGSTTTLGRGDATETTLTGAGSFNYYVARYAPDGTLEWARDCVCPGGDLGSGVAALSDGAVGVIGSFTLTADFGIGSRGDLAAADKDDTFVARYTPTGRLAWVRQVRGPNRVLGYAMDGLSGGGMVVLGAYVGDEATLDGGRNADETLQLPDDDGRFLGRYDADGDLVWATHFDPSEYHNIADVAAFADDSFVVLSAGPGAVTYDPGGASPLTLPAGDAFEILLARFRPDGRVDWVRRLGGLGAQDAYGLATRTTGATLLCGTFLTEIVVAEGDVGETRIEIPSSSDRDGFVAQYAADGSFGEE